MMRTPDHGAEPLTEEMTIRLEYEDLTNPMLAPSALYVIRPRSSLSPSPADGRPPINNARSSRQPTQPDTTNRNPPSTLPTLPVPHPTTSYWHTTHPNPYTHHRSTPHLPATTTILIVGSGITSAFAARHLTSLGHTSILILEARTLCSGATGRNGGHCQPLCYDQAAEVGEFELRNIAHLSEMIAREGVQCDWSPYPGGGCHAFFERGLFESVKGTISAMKQTAPTLAALISVVEDPAELARLKIPAAVGAVLQARAASLHPYKLVTHIWRTLLEDGDARVNLQTNTPVTRLERATEEGTWHVHTERGTVVASHVLLATNAYTARLAPEFEGLIVPVQGQMSALKPTRWALETPLRHDYGFRGVMEQDKQEDDYLVQRPVGEGGGAGEFMFGGGRMAGKGEGIGVSDDSFVDRRVRDYLRGMLVRLMDVTGLEGRGGQDGHATRRTERLPRRYSTIEADLPQTALEPLAEWTGIMGYSRDGHPWVGSVPDHDGLWVSAGYTGHGMPNTSLCGKHVAGLISAAVTGEDWREVERAAVEGGGIPGCYVVSRERMEGARASPELVEW